LDLGEPRGGQLLRVAHALLQRAQTDRHVVQRLVQLALDLSGKNTRDNEATAHTAQHSCVFPAIEFLRLHQRDEEEMMEAAD